MTLTPAALKSLPIKIAILAGILASHLVPSVIIGFGFVIPGSCIEGATPQTLGYIACLIGFIPTFTFGVITAWQFGRAGAAAAPATPIAVKA